MPGWRSMPAFGAPSTVPACCDFNSRAGPGRCSALRSRHWLCAGSRAAWKSLSNGHEFKVVQACSRQFKPVQGQIRVKMGWRAADLIKVKNFIKTPMKLQKSRSIVPNPG